MHQQLLICLSQYINNHLFSLTSTVYLSQSIHLQSLIYLPLYTNNILFAAVSTATIIYSAGSVHQYSFASVYTSTITCLPQSSSPGLGDGERTLIITCVPWSQHRQLLVCLSLYIKIHLFASVYPLKIACLPRSVH